jgi:hypothetical protein
MKSKLIAAINAVLKSCNHKPILIMAFILGAWLTPATKAHAQTGITWDNPIEDGGTYTNTDCYGNTDFSGQDWNSDATTVYLWINYVNTYYAEVVYYGDDDYGVWYIWDVDVTYTSGVSPCYVTDDSGGQGSPNIYVVWYPCDS